MIEPEVHSDSANDKTHLFQLPKELQMSPNQFRPKFKRVPVYYYKQSIAEKLICLIIVILCVALATAFTFVLTLWTMATSSTKFALIWFSLGMAFFISIAIINSFSDVPQPEVDSKLIVASAAKQNRPDSPMLYILNLGNLIMFCLTIDHPASFDLFLFKLRISSVATFSIL